MDSTSPRQLQRLSSDEPLDHIGPGTSGEVPVTEPLTPCPTNDIVRVGDQDLVQVLGGRMRDVGASAHGTRQWRECRADDVAMDPFGIHLLAHEMTHPTGGLYVQRRGYGAAPTAAHGTNSGAPLACEVESRFGIDFSVHAHSHAETAAASQAIGAEACTMDDATAEATPEILAVIEAWLGAAGQPAPS